MSITISDCLKFPSLREARVLAGHKGLDQAISTVSVLEWAKISAMADQLFLGAELILSAFISVKDSVEEQCAAIRRLHEVGEAGLILYYVGYFLPYVDQKLIDVADELGFPLIIMPPNTYHHRYSEVMTEIQEAIFEERRKETDIVPGLLDRITKLAERQRTIDSVLRMLSDRFRCSFLLLDREGKERGFAGWPMAENELAQYFRQMIEENGGTGQQLTWKGGQVALYHCGLDTGVTKGMQLYAVDETSSLSDRMFRQAAEVVQMFGSIWNTGFLREEADGLVRAVLNDQAGAIRRISTAWHIDMKALRTIWILRSRQAEEKEPEETLIQKAVELKGFLKEQGRTVVADTFDGCLVAFMDDVPDIELNQALAEEFMAQHPDRFGGMGLAWSGGMDSIQDIRRSYMLVESCFSEVCTIFPSKNVLTLREFAFARECKELMARGGASLAASQDILSPLYGQKDEGDLLDTLAVYLIDANKNVDATAAALYVHGSTVKYRIRKIQQRLGFDISQMPAMYYLYRAAALRRLSEQER